MSCKWASEVCPRDAGLTGFFCGLSPAAWQGCAPAPAAHPAPWAPGPARPGCALAACPGTARHLRGVLRPASFTGAHGGHADGHGHMQDFA